LRALFSRVFSTKAGASGSGASRGTANPLAQGFAPIARRAYAEVTAGNAALLDVRRDDEWASGHAPMALHLELAKLEAGQLPDIPKDRPVYVHCAAGARAGKAADILTQKGWEHVFNLGGLNDWKAAGGPVVTE
jgi:rhodanese-related sulfurtransferase